MIRNLILMSFTLSTMISAQGLDKALAADRQTWIIATSLPEGIESPVGILAGGKLSELTLSKRSVGAAIKVPQDGIIPVVKPTTAAAGGESSYETLVSIKIPEGMKESLVVLVPDASLEPPLKFKAHVVDLKKFRDGQALFVNLTKFEISVVLGDRQTTILSGQLEPLDIGGPEGDEKVPISYSYRSPEEKEWSLISASTISPRPSLREILIFSYNAELEQIGYHGMSFHVSE